MRRRGDHDAAPDQRGGSGWQRGAACDGRDGGLGVVRRGVCGFRGSAVGGGDRDAGGDGRAEEEGGDVAHRVHAVGEGARRAHLVHDRDGVPLGAKARLVYAKAALTEDLSWDLRSFHHRDSRFPHHSLSRQIFTDEQFEAYRSLGHAAGRRAAAVLNLPR